MADESRTRRRDALPTAQGVFEPLEDYINLYLVIERQADGSYGAYVRDPEHNAGIWLRITGVTMQGDEVRFARSNGEDIIGKYDEPSDTLFVTLPSYPEVSLQFKRHDLPKETARLDIECYGGFYPRTPSVDRYEYAQPRVTDDGWQTASLTDVGLDPEPITALVERILHTETTSVTTPYIQGLLIARHGKLVLDEYFYGFHSERPHDLRSASKSLTAALVGIAIDRGAPFDVSTPVYSLFPEYNSFAHDDPRKHSMTVEHLLTMTSGLECDDNDDDSPGNEDNMQSQEAQPDWYKYTLDLPMAREPGEQGVYCSAGINLLGGIITNATGEWLPEFFHEHCAKPLDFGRYHALLTRTGNMYGGGGSYMRPRDFMKLGQVYLDGGHWNGRQIISEDWVHRSLQPHSRLENHFYGYGWHLGEYEVAGKTYPRAEAGGNGGQFVIIIPSLDMVVMFTAANYGNYGTWSKFRDELVPEYIIPAAL